MSDNKLYKVSREDLDKVTKAINIVSMLLGKIALSNMLESAELPDPRPATLDQAVDNNLEAALDRMEAKAHHCHRIGGGKHLAAVCPRRKPAKTAPLPKTMKEIAAAAGVEYKQVQKYAYTHKIGKASKTADCHQCRIFTENEVKAILEHFKK